jgi:type IV pilus assembly protein PilA
MKIKNSKGFTLIELLIVVAIIAILAAIAIPQFAAYRMKGYNSTALSDLRNLKTAEESLYADMTAYGSTDGGGNPGVALDAAAPAAGGVIWNGPLAPAVGGTAPVPGARIAGVNASGATSAMAMGVSNGVNIIASCSIDAASAPVAGAYNSYVVAGRHENGDTAYASDSDNTVSIYRVSNAAWTGVPDVLSATAPAPTIGVDNLNGAAGGGSPTGIWTII